VDKIQNHTNQVALRNLVCYHYAERSSFMNILHVRSVPDDLYQQLQRLARARNRSLSAQVVEILAQAVAEDALRLEQSAALNSIRRRRFSLPEQAPTSLELLHEDRAR
jgi:plasmid stability protein